MSSSKFYPSPQLAHLLGVDQNKKMSKQNFHIKMRSYLFKKKLYQESKTRGSHAFFIPDDDMEPIFGKEEVLYVHLMKYIKPHLLSKPSEECLDFDDNEEDYLLSNELSFTHISPYEDEIKAFKQQFGPEVFASIQKTIPGLRFDISDELGEVIGDRKTVYRRYFTRKIVTDRIEAYIKTKNLVDPVHKRFFYPDTQLKPIFGLGPVFLDFDTKILDEHLKLADSASNRDGTEGTKLSDVFAEDYEL